MIFVAGSASTTTKDHLLSIRTSISEAYPDVRMFRWTAAVWALERKPPAMPRPNASGSSRLLAQGRGWGIMFQCVSMVFMSESGQHQSFLEFVGRNRVQEARNPCVFHGKNHKNIPFLQHFSWKHHNSIQTSVIISCTLSCFICFIRFNTSTRVLPYVLKHFFKTIYIYIYHIFTIYVPYIFTIYFTIYLPSISIYIYNIHI